MATKYCSGARKHVRMVEGENGGREVEMGEGGNGRENKRGEWEWGGGGLWVEGNGRREEMGGGWVVEKIW